MNNAVLCGHTGSLNRGCEAIIKSTAKILGRYGVKTVLATFEKEDDFNSGVSEFDEVISYSNLKDSNILEYVFAGISSKCFNYKRPLHYLIQRNVWKAIEKNIAVNVGGDTYCYDKPYISMFLNAHAKKNNIPCVLWGCSIEKDVIDDEIFRDLETYTMIFPRETLTYDNLVQVGIQTEKLYLMADPAFTLDTQEVQLPANFMRNNMLGVNLSPIVMNSARNKDLAMQSCCEIIDYAIKNTTMNIALIPHVYTENTEDILPLRQLFLRYKHTNRVVLFSEYYNCKQLKYIISQCRFLVAARTHATIAGYSSCIPTLAIGYSIKSKGIANDIFGKHDGYVCSVQDLKDKGELLAAFRSIEKEEIHIKTLLEKTMPSYIERAWQAGSEINKLIGGFNV